MSKRFAILLGECTKAQEEAVKAYIQIPGTAWWHWLPNAWLLSDPSGKLTANKLRDDLRQVIPGMFMLVLEFSDAGYTWAGFGPKTNEKDMFKWIRENWGNR